MFDNNKKTCFVKIQLWRKFPPPINTKRPGSTNMHISFLWMAVSTWCFPEEGGLLGSNTRVSYVSQASCSTGSIDQSLVNLIANQGWLLCFFEDLILLSLEIKMDKFMKTLMTRLKKLLLTT